MILNIAGYKFIALDHLNDLRVQLLEHCHQLQLKGTILLSVEGINLNLSGDSAHIQLFKSELAKDKRFADMRFHEASSPDFTFKRLKVKIKKEIITLRQPEANPLGTRAPIVTPAELKQWLDENRALTLLDTRNDYEVEYGSFNHAVNLHLSDFSEFPHAVASIHPDKPVVMFCTGGIRCEKAALYMLNQGHKNVYQLNGGILGYFAQVGDAHYQGKCFVFDERVAIDAPLNAK